MGFLKRVSELSWIESNQSKHKIQEIWFLSCNMSVDTLLFFGVEMTSTFKRKQSTCVYGGGCIEGRSSSFVPTCGILGKTLKLILQHNCVMWPK